MPCLALWIVALLGAQPTANTAAGGPLAEERAIAVLKGCPCDFRIGEVDGVRRVLDVCLLGSTEEAMRCLEDFSQLQDLYLNHPGFDGWQLTDAMLVHLKGLTQLKTLTVGQDTGEHPDHGRGTGAPGILEAARRTKPLRDPGDGRRIGAPPEDSQSPACCRRPYPTKKPTTRFTAYTAAAKP
jgi:hypothetical protein